MKQPFVYVGLDVDDTQYHSAKKVLSKPTLCAPYLSSTWPYATPFAEIIQPTLKRTTRPLATRITLSFIRI